MLQVRQRAVEAAEASGEGWVWSHSHSVAADLSHVVNETFSDSVHWIFFFATFVRSSSAKHCVLVYLTVVVELSDGERTY
jgi:hypothetical protein